MPRSKKKSSPSTTVDVRAAVLSHATRLFAARGFDGTPIQEIADAVGIAKPSLLYHFSTKDALRRAVLDETLSRWNLIIPDVLRAATSGHHQFDSVIRELVSFFAQDHDRARLLIREILDRPEEFRALLSTHVSPWIEVVSGHIRRGQEKGDIRADVDPEAYVIHVINLVLSSLATYDRLGSFLPFDRLENELLRLAKSSLFVS